MPLLKYFFVKDKTETTILYTMSSKAAQVPTFQNINDALDVLLKKYNIEHVQPSGALLADNINNNIGNGNMLQVKMEQIENGDENSCNENGLDIRKKTLFCHICNLDVPSAFMTQHTAGSRHLTLLQLTQAALERVNRHLAQQINKLSCCIQDEAETDCNNNSPSTRYCIDCNEFIDDSSQHEDTIEHKIAIEKGKLMTRLSDLYSDKATDTVIQSINEISAPAAEDLAVKPDVIHGNANMTMPIDDKPATANKDDASNKNSDVTRTCNQKLSVVETRDGSDVVVNIFAKNGDKVAVTKYHWHSICLCEDKYFNCNVCDALLQPIGDLEQHLKMAAHQERVNVFVEDKNCIRKLPNESVHCIICNSIHLDEYYHVSRDSHRQSVEAAAALYIRGLLEPTTGDAAPTDESPSLKKEKSKEMKSFYSRKTITKRKQSKEPHLCPVCHVRVCNSAHSISQHVNGKIHRRNCLQQMGTTQSQMGTAQSQMGTAQSQMGTAQSEPIKVVMTTGGGRPQSPVRGVVQGTVRGVMRGAVLCPYCRERCPGQLMMKLHVERAHGLRQVSLYRTYCLHCARVFPHYDQAELNLHLSHPRLYRYYGFRPL